MNSRLLIAFLCITSLSTGCIIEDDCHSCHPEPARSGDVTFLWTLDGLRCDQARDVYGVNITIPGETLLNNGEYGCSTSGVDGITLHDFAPGTYSFHLEAVDYRGVVVFEGAGTFTINGDARVTIDLAPVGQQESYAYLNWTFPGNQSCSQAGVQAVEIFLDGVRVADPFPCVQGQSTPGLKTGYMSPGNHTISFTAIGFQGEALYYATGPLTTQPYDPVFASYRLTDGGASLSWRFSDGSVNFDCAQIDPAGTMEVGVNLQDVSTGAWVYGNSGDWHPCSGKPIVYRHLRPGNYKISLYAKTSNNVEYRSNPNIGSLQVAADQYPGPNNSLEVVMYRQ
ncbi:hypothetical protein [Hyalangium versicolor]|uniref:hypothetical protein n=1 Tax=Hyalangium versicolor TaxID=2861190 RepID=UPI001CCCA302|nr:hypothetical protein [Hyalangium versicolor]